MPGNPTLIEKKNIEKKTWRKDKYWQNLLIEKSKHLHRQLRNNFLIDPNKHK